MLPDLPSDIHDMIVKVVEPSDLMNLRLASKVLSAPATHRLFSHIHVTPREPSHRAFHSILASPERSKDVSSVKFTTGLHPDMLHDDYIVEAESVLSKSYQEIIQSVGEFPNLLDVDVEFSAICSAHDPMCFYRPLSAPESVEFRSRVLETLFSSLNDPDHPVSKLRSLTFKNLQGHNVKTITSSPDFISTLSRISELRLKIVTEYDVSCPDGSWEMPQMHEFFAELPALWLKPASQITSLILHSDVYFGYHPKCDLRGTHFPNLKRLELQNFSFTHDWQLDWILSHGQTLERLLLNGCPIINHIQNYGPMDEEKYLVWPPQGREYHQWHYAQKWSNFLLRIEEGLPKLKMFKLGNFYSWESTFDGADWEDVGLHESRYLAFDKGTGPSPWIELKEVFETADGILDHTQSALIDPSSATQLEDETAYQKLMATVWSRAGS